MNDIRRGSLMSVLPYPSVFVFSLLVFLE